MLAKLIYFSSFFWSWRTQGHLKNLVSKQESVDFGNKKKLEQASKLCRETSTLSGYTHTHNNNFAICCQEQRWSLMANWPEILHFYTRPHSIYLRLNHIFLLYFFSQSFNYFKSAVAAHLKQNFCCCYCCYAADLAYCVWRDIRLALVIQYSLAILQGPSSSLFYA